jgi:hypothetical protein
LQADFYENFFKGEKTPPFGTLNAFFDARQNALPPTQVRNELCCAAYRQSKNSKNPQHKAAGLWLTLTKITVFCCGYLLY